MPLSRGQSVLEWTALLLLLAAPVAGMWMFGATRLWGWGPLLAGVFLAALLAGLRPFLFTGADRLQLPPGALPAVLVMGIFAALAFRADIPHEARLDALRTAGVVLAWLAWPNLADHHRRWRYVAGLLLFAITIMACYALVQHLRGSNLVLGQPRPEHYGMRASGAFICPNHFAHLITLGLCLSLALALNPQAGAFLRLLGLYNLLVLPPALFLTQSRSGWMGALTGVGVILCLQGWRAGTRRFLLTLLVVPLALAALGGLAWAASPMVQSRVAEALRGDMRLPLWSDTVRMVEDRPWFGFGPGSFRWVYPHYQRHLTRYLDPIYAHNEYLNHLADVGAVGTLAVGIALLTVAVRLLPFVRRARRPKDAWLVMGALGALAGSLVHAVFDFNLQIFANTHALVALFGLAVSGLFAAGDLTARPLPRPALRAIGAATLVAAAAGLALLIRPAGAYRLYRQAVARQEVLREEEALSLYRRSASRDATFAPAWIGQGDLLRTRCFWARDPAVRKEEAAAAEAAYAAARRANPWHTAPLFGQARLHQHLGQSADAIRCLQELTKLAPFHAYFQSELGLSLTRAGRYAEALEAFRASRTSDPTPMADRYIAWLEEQLRTAPR